MLWAWECIPSEFEAKTALQVCPPHFRARRPVARDSIEVEARLALWTSGRYDGVARVYRLHELLRARGDRAVMRYFQNIRLRFPCRNFIFHLRFDVAG